MDTGNNRHGEARMNSTWCLYPVELEICEPIDFALYQLYEGNVQEGRKGEMRQTL